MEMEDQQVDCIKLSGRIKPNSGISGPDT